MKIFIHYKSIVRLSHKAGKDMLNWSIVMLMCALASVSDGSNWVHQETKLIGGLNDFFHFDHNIFLMDINVDMKIFINGKELTPKSIFVHQKNFTQRAIQSKNTLLIAVSTNCKFDNYTPLLKQVREIQELHRKIKIGIFFAENGCTAGDLRELFEWSKKVYIVDIFAAIHAKINSSSFNDTTFNVFTYNLYGPLNIINLTHSTYGSFFANRKSNYKRLSVERYDAGYEHTVLMPTNFVIEEVYQKDWSNHYGNLSDGYEYAISTSPAMSYDCDTRVFPISTLAEVIVVPQSLPFSDFTAYLQSFMSQAFFVYFAIAVAMVVLTIIRCVEHKKTAFIRSVVDVTNLLMNDNGDIRYQRLSPNECYLIVPLTFVGLVFVNGILSSLQSYLTRPIFQVQMSTLEDIHRSKLPIFIWTNSWKKQIIENLKTQSNIENWNDTLVAMDLYELGTNVSSYNRIGFVTNLALANSLVQTQKRLNIRGYHITDIEVGHMFFHYTHPNSFVYWERLNEIVLMIQCAGLYDQWHRENFAFSEKKIFKRYLERLSAQEGSAVTGLDFPLFITYGWLAGGVVLIFEIFWKRLFECRDVIRRVSFWGIFKRQS